MFNMSGSPIPGAQVKANPDSSVIEGEFKERE
jgi:hypothetical protein